MTTEAVATYPGHRFPAEIMQHAACLYHVFSLRPHDVELILAERGIAVAHESIPRWCIRFGSEFAARAPAAAPA